MENEADEWMKMPAANTDVCSFLSPRELCDPACLHISSSNVPDLQTRNLQETLCLMWFSKEISLYILNFESWQLGMMYT